MCMHICISMLVYGACMHHMNIILHRQGMCMCVCISIQYVYSVVYVEYICNI